MPTNRLGEKIVSTYILTSMFPTGFNHIVAKVFQKKITKRNRYAFVASEFEKIPEKTDQYFRFFLNMFEENGIHFKEASVVDGRMTMQEAQTVVETSDVVWLSGGDTPTQFDYLQRYGLDTVIKQHNGVIIGMSAGSINLESTAICTLSCGHDKQLIYEGLGCVDISIEPHFIRSDVSDELLELSQKYVIYGLCDDSIIVCEKENIEFYGEIYRIQNRSIVQIEPL